MPSGLHGSHLDTYKSIFRHPTAHNLQWRDVRSMLSALAELVEEPNGSMKITRNGQTIVLHPRREKDITDVDELVKLRHFLDKSGVQGPAAASDKHHLLVVIDHREARVYETEMHGAAPHRVQPYDANGFGRHLHYVQDDSNGQRKPESGNFYNDVIKTLKDAEQILIFGTGKGASSAMTQLVAELKQHHKPLAARVIGAVVVDETHLSDDQLLAKAREIYEHASAETAAK